MMYSAIPFLKSTPQKPYIYIESTMMALRLLVSDIWWHSGHFLNGRQMHDSLNFGHLAAGLLLFFGEPYC